MAKKPGVTQSQPDGAALAGGAGRNWSVWRCDDNGNIFLVKDGLTEAEARQLQQDYTGKGHKQTYWVQEGDERPA